MVNTELLFRTEVLSTGGCYSYDISFLPRRPAITIMYTSTDGMLKAFPRQESYEIPRNPVCTLGVDTTTSGDWIIRNGIETRDMVDIARINHSTINPVSTLIMNGEEVACVGSGLLRLPKLDITLDFPQYEYMKRYFNTPLLRRSGQHFIDRLVRGSICFGYAAHLQREQVRV